jgi:hypothetical protein
VYLGLEYRRTEYRVPSSMSLTMNRSNDELYVNLGLDF